ncbi:MAG TPA: hypothetical protein VGI81_16160 [Tepidisphaeraceae bacterium]|jgi:hypothetical protein
MSHVQLWLVLGFVSLLASLFIGFSILLIVVAMFEKHPIRSLTPLAPSDVPRLSPYAEVMNEQVREAGFTFLGHFAPSQGGMYKTITTAWLSPDRTTRVLVTGGTTVGIKTRRTTLTSRTSDDIRLLTTDEFDESDLTGRTDQSVLLRADFFELWQAHQFRLSQAPGLLQHFDTDNLPEQRRREIEKHARRLAELRYARYTDPAQTAWRYTPLGAFVYWHRGFLRQLSEARNQQDRSRLPRVGT